MSEAADHSTIAQATPAGAEEVPAEVPPQEEVASPTWVDGLHMLTPFIILIGLCGSLVLLAFSGPAAAAVGCLTLLLCFGACFYHEVRSTPWTIGEALVLFVGMGHAVALPVKASLEYVEQFPDDAWVFPATLIGGVLLALFIAGGGVWALRRLNALEERRPLRRLFYQMVGMLVFPCMVSFMIIGSEDFRMMGMVLLCAAPFVWLLARHLQARVEERKRAALRKRAATAD